jgi:hypothetical protein
VTASESGVVWVDAATFKEAGVVRFAGGKGSAQGLVNNVEEMGARLETHASRTTAGAAVRIGGVSAERAGVTVWHNENAIDGLHIDVGDFSCSLCSRTVRNGSRHVHKLTNMEITPQGGAIGATTWVYLFTEQSHMCSMCSIIF